MLGTEPRAFSRSGIGSAKEPHLVKEPSSWTLDPGHPLLMVELQKPLGAGSQGRLPGEATLYISTLVKSKGAARLLSRGTMARLSSLVQVQRLIVCADSEHQPSA